MWHTPSERSLTLKFTAAALEQQNQQLKLMLSAFIFVYI